MRCDGKVVVLAGGGSGIGRSAANTFAEQGGRVVVADVDANSAMQVADELRQGGAVASAMACDVTDRGSVVSLFEQTVAEHGRVDILASTVGWSDTTFFVDEDEAYWRKLIDINLMSSIYLCYEALRYMIPRASGSIVLTSSDAGKVGTTGETVYAAAKAGVIGFVKSLAREISRSNLRINAIAPGPTDTPLLRAQSDQHVIDRMIRSVPLKRMGQPVEQANAMVFLASEAASYITGQTLSVSGGLTMTS